MLEYMAWEGFIMMMSRPVILGVLFTFLVIIATCIWIYWYMKRDEKRILANGVDSTAVIAGFSVERTTDPAGSEPRSASEHFMVALDLWDVTIGEVVATSTSCTNKAYKKRAVGSTLPVKYIKSQNQAGETQYKIIVTSEEEEWKRPTLKHFAILMAGIIGCLVLLLAGIYLIG